MNKLTAMLIPSVVPIIRAGAFLLLLGTPLLAQGNPTFPQPATRDNPRTNPAELNGRNTNITLLESGKDEAQKRQLVMAQMNEDFERIQSIDKDILSSVSTSAVPDYKHLSDGLAEIKKRAIRLKTNLVLPPTVKEEKAQKKRDGADTSQLQPAVSMLNDLITSFVANPLFTKGATVDFQLVAKARHDLDGIIDFSDKIRKRTDTLNASPSKP